MILEHLFNYTLTFQASHHIIKNSFPAKESHKLAYKSSPPYNLTSIDPLTLRRCGPLPNIPGDLRPKLVFPLCNRAQEFDSHSLRHLDFTLLGRVAGHEALELLDHCAFRFVHDICYFFESHSLSAHGEKL